jgi:hypothetical protein
MEEGAARILRQWLRAFPRNLADDVAAAIGSMPAAREPRPPGSDVPSMSVDADEHRVVLTVGGDLIDIPYRFYNDAIQPWEASTSLSARQRTVLGCIFTRHYSGYVRHQWAREVVRVTEAWVVPFVLQLLGEYVVEIIVDLEQGLRTLGDPRSAAASVYREVLRDNPEYLRLTAQRVASYWDCYYRGRYPDIDDYPAHTQLRKLELLARAADPGTDETANV